MTLHVRAFDPADIDALLALQHATAGAAPRWSRAFLAAELTDPARAGGHHVVIVSDGERVRAGSGYVPAGNAFFVAPSFAADVDAAALLLAELERRAGPADYLRASAFPGELAKAEALANAGFTRRFAFITVARASDANLTPSSPFVRSPVADVPLEAMRAAHNLAFAGVPNSPEQSLDETRYTVARLFAPASGVWRAADGSLAGYLWVLRDEDSRGPHAVIDAVGVLPGQRRAGLGAIMVAHALGAAAAASIPEVRALIASTNHASLALHQAAGFAEVWRREVWQRDLAP